MSEASRKRLRGRVAKPRALAPLFATRSRATPNNIPQIQSLFQATLGLICIYCLGGLIVLIGYLRLFRLRGVTTFSFIMGHSSKKSLLSLLVFSFVLMRKLIIPQLNVVTKSLRMSCKG